MSDREEDSVAPWGYLLPMRDGPPPLELRQDNVTVGTTDDCTLHVDAALFGLPADAAPQILFAVRRDRSTGRALLRCEIDAMHLYRKEIHCGLEETLLHGTPIAFQAQEVTYVFVNREKCDSFRAPPDVLEEYLVGHCLGRGGFGKVYILFDKKANYQRKAMKIVEPNNETQLIYTERQARILMTLKHPCVIETFSVKRLRQQHFLVMEYMAGGDLRLFVNDQRLLTEAQTKLLFFQLTLAVEYLHAREICHRDLNPSNVLLQHRTPYTVLKLAGFGLAKDEEDDSSLNTFVGTQHYLAPEIMSYENYTNSVDVWSLGIVLFYSLTGARPFKSLAESVRHRHEVKYDKGSWHNVSVEAQNLVRSMLKVEPADRVTVKQVLEDRWLQDHVMREDAFRLLGLEDVSPRTSMSPSITVSTICTPNKTDHKPASPPTTLIAKSLQPDLERKEISNDSTKAPHRQRRKTQCTLL